MIIDRNSDAARFRLHKECDDLPRASSGGGAPPAGRTTFAADRAPALVAPGLAGAEEHRIVASAEQQLAAQIQARPRTEYGVPPAAASVSDRRLADVARAAQMTADPAAGAAAERLFRTRMEAHGLQLDARGNIIGRSTPEGAARR